MDANQLPLLQKQRHVSPPMSRRIRSSVCVRIAMVAILSALVFWGLTQDGFFFQDAPDKSVVPPPSTPPATEGKLVPLEAHIMSKCPDARDCLHDLILPAMQQVYDKTNFTLSFIGQ